MFMNDLLIENLRKAIVVRTNSLRSFKCVLHKMLRIYIFVSNNKKCLKPWKFEKVKKVRDVQKFKRDHLFGAYQGIHKNPLILYASKFPGDQKWLFASSG